MSGPDVLWSVIEALLIALVPVAVGGIAALGRLLWQKWHREISASDREFLELAARTAVLYAEQVLGSATGAAKRAEAIKVVEAKLTARGIHIDVEEIVAAIHAAVYELTRDKVAQATVAAA
jgi:hypothetical protein